jgi:hypothetical protein
VKTKPFKNMGWKIGGLLLSFALWFHLTTQQQYNQTVMVEIEYINIPIGLKIAPESLKTVSLEVSANGKQLIEMIYFDTIRLVVNLSKIKKPGKYSIELSREQLNIPISMDNVRTSFIGLRACDFELISEQTIDASSGH